ncbi:MAG: glycosyltransferase [Verrucomicrobiae bacterium]
MNSTPRISVLMTVFNGGRFLAESVESILAQTFRDFEFVIVDDTSTDGSVAVLESYASRDPRIRLILRKENSGQTACLNQGLEECRADWVARQDADDISHPQRLAAQLQAVENNPSLVLLGVNGRIIGEAGEFCGMIHVPAHDAGIRWALPFRNPFIHTGVLFRRCHPDGAPIRYDSEFTICQDWELWARLAGDGQVANLKDRLVFYRHRAGSLSNQFSTRTREENRLVVAEIWRRHFPARPLTSEEATLLEAFREGLLPEHWKKFKTFYDGARRAWLAGGPGRNRDRQTEAVHFLQAAGALAGHGRSAAGDAIVQAFFSDPAWTLTTLFQRLFPATGFG